MMETLVSIMPLVENRDMWKRRALVAEDRCAAADALVESQHTESGKPVLVKASSATPIDGHGEAVEVRAIARDALASLAYELLCCGYVVATTDGVNLKLGVVAVKPFGATSQSQLFETIGKAMRSE